MATINCPTCGGAVDYRAAECGYCGSSFAAQSYFQVPPPPPPPNHLYGNQQAAPFNQAQGQPPYFQQHHQPYGHAQSQHYQQPYGQPGMHQYGQPYYQPVYRNPKNKIAAGLLGIFLGGFGIHKFYLGRIGWGIVYLLFCWTYIPAIVGFIEGIVYLATDEERFHMKYSR